MDPEIEGVFDGSAVEVVELGVTLPAAGLLVELGVPRITTTIREAEADREREGEGVMEEELEGGEEGLSDAVWDEDSIFVQDSHSTADTPEKVQSKNEKQMSERTSTATVGGKDIAV